MKRIVGSLSLAFGLAGCSTVIKFIPHYAAAAEGSASVQAVVGVDVLAANAAEEGAIVIYLRPNGSTEYVERHRYPLKAGEGLYRRIEWGKKEEGQGKRGWFRLTEISCAEAKVEYPWLKCPLPSERPQGALQAVEEFEMEVDEVVVPRRKQGR